MKKLTEEGAKIRFPKGNKIPYGQDFSMKRGVPDDVEFTVVSILEIEDHRLQLRGPGYGEKDNYGNGAIYVSMRELENIEIESDETPEETPLEKAKKEHEKYSCLLMSKFREQDIYDAWKAADDYIDELLSALTAKDEEIKRLKEEPEEYWECQHSACTATPKCILPAKEDQLVPQQCPWNGETKWLRKKRKDGE